jgi:hypothetical protein
MGVGFMFRRKIGKLKIANSALFMSVMNMYSFPGKICN